MKETLQKVELTSVDKTAVCNDGSPATYYWKKSTTGSNKWLVFLMGGGQCYDQQSCEERWNADPNHFMMSSKSYPETYKVGGIMSPNPDESPLHDANKAYLFYCSSDGHMGQVGGPTTAAKLWDWQFRGQNNVRAMITHLVTQHGLGGPKSKQDLVVFGGASAGGRGAMTHLDHVAEDLANHNVRVLGHLDSPLYLDLDTTTPSKTKGLNYHMKMAFENFQEKSFMPKDCLAAYDEDH